MEQLQHEVNRYHQTGKREIERIFFETQQLESPNPSTLSTLLSRKEKLMEKGKGGIW